VSRPWEFGQRKMEDKLHLSKAASNEATTQKQPLQAASRERRMRDVRAIEDRQCDRG